MGQVKLIRLVPVLVLCFAAGLLVGCKAPNLQDRMNDAAQMVRLNVGWGPGLLANAQVTRVLGLGLGAYDSRRMGFRNGYGWIWDERRYDLNLIAPIWGWEDVDATLAGGMPVTPLHGDEHKTNPPGEKPSKFSWTGVPRTLSDKNRGWFEVSANVHLVWIGLEVGVDFGEIVDYLVGWFGFDPAGDDSYTGKTAEEHSPSSPPPSPPR